MIRIVGDAGYLQGASTDPKFRGKGVYRGLVAKLNRSTFRSKKECGVQKYANSKS